LLGTRPTTRLNARWRAIWGALFVLVGSTTTDPAHSASAGPRHIFRVAPIKAGDDWGQFINKLEDYQSALPNVDVQVSTKKFIDESCDDDPKCDVVTIEKNTERHYSFKLKNGNRTHMPRYSCATCENNTPIEQCMPVAETGFAGFIIRHNICHQDQARCSELACSQ
jgi:hypothetical protein